ncbi:hypothetical protein FALCPG4_003778 [Fusarium falciforme]
MCTFRPLTSNHPLNTATTIRLSFPCADDVVDPTMDMRKVEKCPPSCGPGLGSALLPQTSVVSRDDVVPAMSPAPPPPATLGATVWQCCNCASGWFSVTLDRDCPVCYAPRCSNCKHASF